MGRRYTILPRHFAWQMKKYIYLFILSVISLNIIISPLNVWADEEADRKARGIMVDLLYQISQQLEDFNWKKIKDPVKRAVIGGREMYTSKDYCPAEFGERRARIALVMAATAKDIADTLREMQAVLYKGARLATRIKGYGVAVDGLDVILAAGNALSSSRTEGEFAKQYLYNLIPIIAGKGAAEAAKRYSSSLSHLIDKGGEVISIDEVFGIFLEDVIGAISQEATKSAVEKTLVEKKLKVLKNDLKNLKKDVKDLWSEKTNIKEFLSIYNREVNFKWTQDWVQGCSSDIFASMNIAKRYLILNVITRCSCKENEEKAPTYLFANRPRVAQLKVRAQINIIKASTDGYRFKAKIVDKSRKAQCCDGKKSKPLEFKPLQLLDGKHSEGQTVRVTIKRTKETERTISKESSPNKEKKPKQPSTPERESKYSKNQKSPQGRWNTDWGEMVLKQEGNKLQGPYNFSNGRLFMTLQGRRAQGIWVQDTSGRRCKTSKDGSHYWGKVVFEFDENFQTFKGKWGYCDRDNDGGWRGTRIVLKKKTSSAEEKEKTKETPQPQKKPEKEPPTPKLDCHQKKEEARKTILNNRNKQIKKIIKFFRSKKEELENKLTDAIIKYKELDRKIKDISSYDRCGKYRRKMNYYTQRISEELKLMNEYQRQYQPPSNSPVLADYEKEIKDLEEKRKDTEKAYKECEENDKKEKANLPKLQEERRKLDKEKETLRKQLIELKHQKLKQLEKLEETYKRKLQELDYFYENCQKK